MDNLKTITLQVCDLAKQVGQYIAEQRELFDRSKAEVKGQNDLVSYVDKTAEEQIIKGLSVILPEAAFLTEEGTVAQSEAEYRWIVDPLDGTTNFVHGIPAFAVSIALENRGKLLSGVVYEVNRSECFYAWKDGGAYLNGKPIHVSESKELSDGLYLTGLPVKSFDKKSQYLEIIGDLMEQTHGLRRIGSAAVDCAYVACGRAEGYFEYNLKPWDIAAGALIVKEAGGTVTDFAGGDNYLYGREIVVAGTVHSQLLCVIQKFWD
jgi:myo-inositol-1(or 4)-monophosphatase